MAAVLIDANIPMYLVGAAHPNKEAAKRLVQDCIVNGDRLVSDAEVLQEILHRYLALGRKDAVQPAFEALFGIVDEVLPITESHVRRARDVVFGFPRLSARDAIHVAVMEASGIASILTFDSAFDAVPGIQRLT